MNKKMIVVTILIQTICVNALIRMAIFNKHTENVQISTISVLAVYANDKGQLTSPPDPFLGSIYYGQEDILNVFDHNLPLFGGYADGNDFVVHYDNTLHNPTPPAGTPGSFIPNGYGYDQHVGIDYNMKYEPVLASSNGTVRYAGWSKPDNHRLLYGLHVQMTHDANPTYRVWYGHLSTLVVQTDDRIVFNSNDLGSYNRVLGISGNTGRLIGCSDPIDIDPLCGAHLHFEVRINGSPVNPYGWIGPSGGDPWANYIPTPPNPDGQVSYNLWATQPAIIPTITNQYPGDTPLTPPPLNNPLVEIDDSSLLFTHGDCWVFRSDPEGISGGYYWSSAVAPPPTATPTPTPTSQNGPILSHSPEDSCYARWTIQPDNFAPADQYDLYVHIPEYATSHSAIYTISHANKIAEAIAVQAAYPNPEHDGWAYLGRYDFTMSDGVDEYIRLNQETITDDGGNTLVADAIWLIPVTLQDANQHTLYLSTQEDGQIGPVSFSDEDILAYDIFADSWSQFLDNSSFYEPLQTVDLDAFEFLADNSIVMSFDAPITFPDIGFVDDSDIVRFNPNTSSYELYLDGSTVSLTSDGEDVDAIAFTPDGRLIISTSGNFSVPGNSGHFGGQGQDLIVLDPTNSFWTIYFDGSDVGLTNSTENIVGGWLSEDDVVYLSVAGNFSMDGFTGDGADIIRCVATSLGTVTDCGKGSGIYWNGSLYGLEQYIVDDFSIDVTVTASCVAPPNCSFEEQFAHWTKVVDNPADFDWVISPIAHSGFFAAEATVFSNSPIGNGYILSEPIVVEPGCYQATFYGRGSGTIGSFGVYGRIRFYDGEQIVGYASIGEGIQMVTGNWQQRIYETYIPEGIDSVVLEFYMTGIDLRRELGGLGSVFIDDVSWVEVDPSICPLLGGY